MPRFYFHLHNGTGLTADEEGRELADEAAARRCAVEDIRSVLCEDIERGKVDLRGRIEVADERGNGLFTVRFAEAVELLPEQDTA